MRDENFGELLDEINAKANQWRLSAHFGMPHGSSRHLSVGGKHHRLEFKGAPRRPSRRGDRVVDRLLSSVDSTFYDIDGPVEQAC